jgi:putative peptidoglycan lipid II flippase
MKKWSLSQVGFGGVILATSSLLSRLLGILRDVVFAKFFGVGVGEGIFALDAYYAAFRIPDLIYTLLIMGAMSAAFIPIYTSLISDGSKEQANRFTSEVIHVLSIGLLFFSLLAFAFAPQLVDLFTPGFSAELQLTTTQLTRIMLISPFFLGLSSVFQGVENSHKKFIGIALAPIVYNLSIVLSALFFASQYGVFALAWGVVFGAFLHFIVQMPGAVTSGFRYHFSLHIWSIELIKFLKLSLPRLFGVAVSQLGVSVDVMIASTLAAGSLSAFNYALNLHSLPHGVVAVSVSLAVFSSLSAHGLNRDKSKFTSLFCHSFHSIFFWVLPAIVGVYLLRTPLIDLLLTGGAFDQEASRLTSKTLAFFIWASLGQSLIPLGARAFYSLQETKTPVLIALFSVSIGVLSSLILTQVYDFDVSALAISSLLSSSLNALLLLLFLKSFARVGFASLVPFRMLLLNGFALALMTLACLMMLMLPIESEFIQVLSTALVGAAVYLLAAFLTRSIPSLREA